MKRKNRKENIAEISNFTEIRKKETVKEIVMYKLLL